MISLTRSAWCSTALFLLCGSLFGQSTPPPSSSGETTQATEIATALVNAHKAWGSGLNSPGAVLTLKETARDEQGIAFRLYSTGLPSGHIYALFQWPVTQKTPSVALTGVTFDKSGLAICAGKPETCGDPSKPDDPIDLRASPVKGEPLRFAIVAQDDPQLRAAINVVPVPNFGQDKGCRLDAILLMPKAALVWLEASGFPNNTDLSITQDSEGEIIKSHKTSDSKGIYSLAVMPAKAGLASGVMRVGVSAAGCNPEVSVPWGAKAK